MCKACDRAVSISGHGWNAYARDARALRRAVVRLTAELRKLQRHDEGGGST